MALDLAETSRPLSWQASGGGDVESGNFQIFDAASQDFIPRSKHRRSFGAGIILTNTQLPRTHTQQRYTTGGRALYVKILIALQSAMHGFTFISF